MLTGRAADPILEGMSGAPDNHEIDKRLAVLEERMNTMQAEYKTDIARLAEDAAKRETRLVEDMAKRDKENTRWQIGLWIAAIVILGILIRWPASG